MSMEPLDAAIAMIDAVLMAIQAPCL